MLLLVIACGESTPPRTHPTPQPAAPQSAAAHPRAPPAAEQSRRQVATAQGSAICTQWLPEREPDCFGDTVDAPGCQVVDEWTVGGTRIVAAEIETGCLGVDSTTHLVAVDNRGPPLVMGTAFSGHGQSGGWEREGAEIVGGGLLVLRGRMSDALQGECTETTRQRVRWTVCEREGARRCATITVSDTARCELHADCGLCDPPSSPSYEIGVRIEAGQLRLSRVLGEVPPGLQGHVADASWERLLADPNLRTPRLGDEESGTGSAATRLPP